MSVCNCCKECGVLFESAIPLVYCSAHKHIDDKQFEEIDLFLRKHPYSNALQINAGTNIPVSEVLRYINEGRLTIVEGKVTIR